MASDKPKGKPQRHIWGGEVEDIKPPHRYSEGAKYFDVGDTVVFRTFGAVPLKRKKGSNRNTSEEIPTERRVYYFENKATILQLGHKECVIQYPDKDALITTYPKLRIVSKVKSLEVP